MKSDLIEVSIKGKIKKFPCLDIDGLKIIVSGKCLKIAEIKDEFWLEGDVVVNPEIIIKRLKHAKLEADLYKFSQKPPSTKPIYQYHLDWTNVAAIPLTSFDDWWGNLSQATRKNVRRAERRGANVKKLEFSDTLIEGIVKLNNSTPFRQGRRFYHYGKSFEEVKRDYSEYADRSEYLGAIFQNELVGILRLIHIGEITGIMQLLCMPEHADKRPANILLSKAVEICLERKSKYILYGQYNYGYNAKATLTEFKKRNGFVSVQVPSYYIPLTVKGRIAMFLNLHKGIKNGLPKPVALLAINLKSFIKSRWRNRSFEENDG